MFASSQTEVQHGIFIPFFLQLSDGKPLKESLLASEITLEGGNQQRLAETAWATQEEILSICMCHTINVFRLVDIEVVQLADFSKV